ncbi:uncharacterized protein BX664DRAFT_202241 [Halteromyces radiatus]|uniref:uncharacterized protein n=1 Tax=Halteromyces radiatus TaxID=101107 RepID=UPI00221FBFE4|nr:uncharacterized protein BX664DRAFT_202241 [Halteromyces radiatus]KAI8079777.1 hypothetical protein BX664DRAFT_202241 [Halteromyces radiatus]
MKFPTGHGFQVPLIFFFSFFRLHWIPLFFFLTFSTPIMDEPTPNLDDTAITKDVPITTDTTTTNDQMDLDLNKESSQSIEQQEAERSLAALESLPDIEEKLSIDNTNYELLVRRIDACKVADLPDALEIAREAMHDVYPLTEQLWLDWIEDVKKNATTEQGEIQLRRLYQEAEQDYLSIPIWTSYVDFIRNKFDQAWDKIEDKNDSDLEEIVNTTREDLLRAVRATAYHVEKSHVIWNAYADFETKLMEHYKSPERFAKLKQIYLDRLGVLHIVIFSFFGYSL